jgi:hypothetical protein
MSVLFIIFAKILCIFKKFPLEMQNNKQTKNLENLNYMLLLVWHSMRKHSEAKIKLFLEYEMRFSRL